MSYWPQNREVTSDIAYIRFHGSKRLYASSYSQAELRQWAEFIKTACAQCAQVFVYFNNDHRAYAVKNAQTLIELLQ